MNDPYLFNAVCSPPFNFAETHIFPNCIEKNDTVKPTTKKVPAIDNYHTVLSVEKYPTPFTAY